MHELSVTRRIVAICSERAGGEPVRRVSVEVGMLCCVMPEALRFCYEALTPGTVLEGSTLAIERVPGHSRCRRCGAAVEMASLLASCRCGSTELEPPIGGDTLRVRSLELAASPTPTETGETS